MLVGGGKDHRPTAGFMVECSQIRRCTELVGEKTDRVPPQPFGGLVSGEHSQTQWHPISHPVDDAESPV